LNVASVMRTALLTVFAVTAALKYLEVVHVNPANALVTKGVIEVPPALILPKIDGRLTPTSELELSKLGRELIGKDPNIMPRDEWENDSFVSKMFLYKTYSGKETFEAYFMTKHDENYLYCYVDFVSARSRYLVSLFFDTRLDGWKSPSAEDDIDIYLWWKYSGKPPMIFSFVGHEIPYEEEIVARAEVGKSPRSANDHAQYEIAVPRKTLTKYPNPTNPNRIGFNMKADDPDADLTIVYPESRYPNDVDVVMILSDRSPAAVYRIAVSISGLPTRHQSRIRVDGTESGLITSGEPWFSREFDIGTSHTVSVDRYVYGPDGTRYFCSENSWSFSFRGTHSFSYSDQYYLDVSSPYGTVSGSSWYDVGSTATFSVAPTEVPMPGAMGLLGAKYVFNHWSTGDTSPVVDIKMGSPLRVTAAWGEDLTSAYSIVAFGLSGIIVVVVVLLARRRRKPAL